jgi:hypothetical protein
MLARGCVGRQTLEDPYVDDQNNGGVGIKSGENVCRVSWRIRPPLDRRRENSSA